MSHCIIYLPLHWSVCPPLSPMPERYHKRQRLEDTDESDMEGVPLSPKPCSSKYSHLQEMAAESVATTSCMTDTMNGWLSLVCACMVVLT